jgi:DNA-binding CsgD family transcriptional regulator
VVIAGPAGRLLDRGRERHTISGLVEASCDQDGRVLWLEGPAGIGKTALLRETRALAGAAGMTGLISRGGHLEQGFAFAIVRQLYEQLLNDAGPTDQQALLSGAARLAAPIVAPGLVTAAGLPGAGPGFAIMHGLYWLTANLAERGPLLILVDDAHWADGPSLQFLAYLARRLEGLHVLIALAVRTGEPSLETELLDTIAHEPATTVVRPTALSENAVARQLVRSGLEAPDEGFVRACYRATGGNPLLVKELLAALQHRRVAPTAAAAGQVGAIAPESVGRRVLSQLGRLPGSATAFARGLAILGDRSRRIQVAALAGLDEASATAAHDALVSAGILEPEALQFVHPIVSAAIYADLAPAARSDAHRSAARLLAEARAPSEQVAAHLLAAEPAGDELTVRRLREAAAAAIAHGGPSIAVGYLRRAVREPPPPEERAGVRFELGSAEALVRAPGAVSTLEEALSMSTEAGQRAQVAAELAWLLTSSGRWGDGVALIQRTLASAEDLAPELALPLEWMRAAAAAFTPSLADVVTAELPRWQAVAEAGGPGGRGLLLLLGGVSAIRTGDRIEVLALVDAGLDDGRLLADEGSASLSLPQAFGALAYVDELARLEDLAQATFDDARWRGSVFGLALAMGYRGLAALQRGALAVAEADLMGGLTVVQEHGLLFALPTFLRYVTDVALERPGMEEVRRLIQGIDLDAALMASYSGALLLQARGMLALADGDRRQAVGDLRRALEIEAALNVGNPIPWFMRSSLALALAPDDRDEARQLVADELFLARQVGLPRAEGVTQRAMGRLVGGDEGIALLREAVIALDQCPSELERARGQLELGGALRRAGWRREAREPLRLSLDLARRSGAIRLAGRAEHELRAAGARPRRRAFSGLEALTASERRVADLAVQMQSNREIAEALFVTAKTVENHLGRIYQKVGIHSRRELRDVMPDKR